MKPGEAKVGQRVRLITHLEYFPDLDNAVGTIMAIVMQIPGAENDVVTFHPDVEPPSWTAPNEVIPIESSCLELL